MPSALRRLTVRPFPLCASLVGVALLVFTSPTMAAVNVAGDVPQASTGFGNPDIPANDRNGDNISDTIDDQGNNVFEFLADPNDPAGGAGGLAWIDPAIWEDYETPQNILVGQTGSGSLEINGGSALRYQHLVLGGAAVANFTGAPLISNATLDLSTVAGAEYDFEMDLNQTDLPTSGQGTVTVTGFGSTFNNDPNVIPGTFTTALQFAGFLGTTTTPDQSDRPDSSGGQNAGYDVFVGLLGGGLLDVNSGGTVQIQDALFVGVGASANGVVSVDGFGSTISAYGREMFDGIESIETDEVASTVGGLGSGALSITNGGRVDLFNGLNLGFYEGVNPPANSSAIRSGTVTVDGLGSVLNVFSTSVTGAPTVPTTSLGTETVSLAIGSMPGALVGERGSGLLTINAGAVVSVQSTEGYQANKSVLDANVGVGGLGEIAMAGGSLNVGNVLSNLGEVTGYGTIRASSFYNGSFDELEESRGLLTASNAEGDVLSILIDGDPAPLAGPSGGDFFNRGEVTGNLSIIANNRFDNEGFVSANGTINSGTFYNSSIGQIAIGAGQRLTINSTAATGDTALSEVDTALALEIQDDADDNGEVDSTGPSFFQANLGSIQVTGGDLEFGNSEPIDPTMPIDRTEAFRNARHVVAVGGATTQEQVIGTIVGRDATLRFNSGLYNTGAIAFSGGQNVVSGRVENGSFDYDDAVTAFDQPGAIVVSGDGTTVVFEDFVENNGIISIGPDDNVVTFLGGLTNTGVIKIASNLAGFGVSESAAIVVGQDVLIQGGTIDFQFLSDTDPTPGFSVALLSADGELDDESLFTELILPDLDPGQFWDVVYDTDNDEVRLEIVESVAIGADFNGDGVVDALDIDVWSANVGILAGASTIQGDADLDGDVDLRDYQLLNEQLFTGVPVDMSGPLTIPEPAGVLLALLAISAGACRRRV